MILADGHSDIFGNETALHLGVSVTLFISQIVSVTFSHQHPNPALMGERDADNLADEKRDTGVAFAELPCVTLCHQDMHPQ